MSAAMFNPMKWNSSIRPLPASAVSVILAAHAIYDIAMDRPLQAEQQTDLAAAYWLALQNMVAGQSREDDWCIIVCSLNIGMVLCEQGIGAEYEQHFVQALDGAFRSRLRGEKLGIWRFDGEAIMCIREALTVHDEQIKIATKEEVRDALAEVHRRILDGKVYMAEAA